MFDDASRFQGGTCWFHGCEQVFEFRARLEQILHDCEQCAGADPARLRNLRTCLLQVLAYALETCERPPEVHGRELQVWIQMAQEAGVEFGQGNRARPNPGLGASSCN